MPAPYPIELRERVVAILDSGGEPLETAGLMNLGVATVGRWKRAWKEDATLADMVAGGGVEEVSRHRA